MKLRKKEINKIKQIITEIFGDCEIYILGSILDDQKRGGDIDIFVVPKEEYSNVNRKIARAKFLIENEVLRLVDIVIHRDFNREIEKEGLKGVRI